MKLINQIAVGNTAEVYLLDNKIVKLFHKNIPKETSEYEATKQRIALSCGLHVPTVLDVTIIDGRQAIIMEYIKGSTLGELLEKDNSLLVDYISISVDIQQNIHAVIADSMETMSVKLQRQIESTDYLTDNQKLRLIQKMKSISYEPKLCHGDYHLFNLVSTASNVTILDWVDASSGDIRADVYRTYLLYSQLSMELADTYVSCYCEKSGLSIDEIFQWAPIIAGARLSEKVSSENNERLIAIVNQYCP
ncbi:aminoglycoside phosphotransferase family protein [Virgibacillus sp. AGTR]|uniref:phosphotransferase family protein n=1 Tax=Virgibacillus TaxID=84406 RepID=UPI000EF493E7|nr:MULTISPECIES: aminoglycoside phosphotransferase family protein [Virgibacillus]MCC2251870.1 aminoglycoside phosphotransferase family protein [Virgibacillus sp. AGTR]QRZ17661.1 aminoglycoside phosphotransferase family protein [Virgibacillus sp. AGTR]WBX78947.1 aminoglycoside phosphotransferase family protein [Virgibacillus salarius]